MNTLHSGTTSAVIRTATPVNHHTSRDTLRVAHPGGRGTEKSGAVSGRGCARGTGRGRPPYSPGYRWGYPQAIDANEVGGHGGSAYGEVTGARSGPQETVNAETAFTAYVQERRASLYATAYHLTGDRYEAEDLLQSALFSTYRAWDRISDKAAVGGYLRRTMTNLHISAWRRRKLNEYPTEELPETAGDQDAMRGTELRAVLWQALARLPELQRTMLVLRYYEGRTDPEIAEILNISVGTVKSSIWRSLRRLREDESLSFGRDEEESFGELVA
ncbi:SigE family RNA polymerase sigma factor [Streptomyces sp. 8N706]|uniref:SigE family RNA polymerase sigma factor n=1 Tax=Streptomyces sp. 8N706 TaxID=3457416 RepID=UPI003FD6AA8E